MSVQPDFVHLRLHSEYSLEDSIIKVKDLAAAVAGMGMGAVAMADKANLFGLIKFYRACLEHGVKPLIGTDAVYESNVGSGGIAQRCRVGLLAMNERGYRNLLKLVSLAYLGENERGVLARDQIFDHAEGLLVLCGGRDGEIGKALLKGESRLAEELAGAWAAYAPDCAGCHANDYKTGPHKKTENPDTRYTVDELRDCTGACHVYTDSSLTTVKKFRPGPEHRVNKNDF